jgi:hypothetical protein
MKMTYFETKYAPAVLIAFVTKIFWTAGPYARITLSNQGQNARGVNICFFFSFFFFSKNYIWRDSWSVVIVLLTLSILNSYLLWLFQILPTVVILLALSFTAANPITSTKSCKDCKIPLTVSSLDYTWGLRPMRIITMLRLSLQI